MRGFNAGFLLVVPVVLIVLLDCSPPARADIGGTWTCSANCQQAQTMEQGVPLGDWSTVGAQMPSGMWGAQIRAWTRDDAGETNAPKPKPERAGPIALAAGCLFLVGFTQRRTLDRRNGECVVSTL